MAKRTAQTDGGEGYTLSAALRRTLDALKRPVTQAANRFGVVRESLAELAPKVMGLFNSIKADNPRFSFVEFVRLFAPDLPTNAADRDGQDGYRKHKVYYTLDYMRRTLAQRPRGRQGVRDNATDGLARAIATIVQVVDPETVWKAIQTEFGFTERAMTGLRRRVEQTKPLFTVEVRKPVPIGKVIHMESARRREPAEGISGADVAAEVAGESKRRTRKREAA